ncbi:MAG: hypothetical protein ABJF50_19210 [Paracoccaceae bacterium]
MHPLHALANALSEKRKARKTHHALKDVLSDPHLARDIGLPHRPRLLGRDNIKF